METSSKQTSLFTEDKSTSSQGDSHVSHSHQPGSEKERTMTAIYGQRCLEQFEKFNRAKLWARTFAASLIGTGDWYSTRCRLTWKLKATKCSRFYFQLAPSMLPTGGIGFGLLPTVLVSQAPYQYSNGDKTRPVTLTLIGKMKAGLLPTPDCSDRRSDKSKQQGLTNFARKGMLPTPKATDFVDRNKSENWDGSDLVSTVKDQLGITGTTSQLNPRFVSEMMGFPPDYLELPFQSTEKNP